jgi:hypothetical protein
LRSSFSFRQSPNSAFTSFEVCRLAADLVRELKPIYLSTFSSFLTWASAYSILSCLALFFASLYLLISSFFSSVSSKYYS